MSGHVLGYALIAAYVAVLVAVASYGLHRYVLLYLYLKHRNDVRKPATHFEQLPRVTVQLPMYNEDVVAERIIEASCKIDYPLDRLEIQVFGKAGRAAARSHVRQWHLPVRSRDDCA